MGNQRNGHFMFLVSRGLWGMSNLNKSSGMRNIFLPIAYLIKKMNTQCIVN